MNCFCELAIFDSRLHAFARRACHAAPSAEVFGPQALRRDGGQRVHCRDVGGAGQVHSPLFHRGLVRPLPDDLANLR